MSELLSLGVLTAFLLGALAASMPLLLAAAGESIAEQSGVLNLGVEGSMLFGALTGYLVTLATGQAWLGLSTGMLTGAVSALPMMLAVWLGWNQIVVGLSVFLAGSATTSVLYELFISQQSARLAPQGTAAYAIAATLVIALAVFQRRSTAMLRLRFAGRDPRALDIAVGRVLGTRLIAVGFGSAMAGLGGAVLSIVGVGAFTAHMTQGIGFLAIVVAMLSANRVWLGALVSLAFGSLVALGTLSQLTEWSLPSDLISIVPFVAVMTVLTFSRFRTAVNPNLGKTYTR